MTQPDLFGPTLSGARDVQRDGFALLRGFALPQAGDILAAIATVEAVAPFRHMITPGGHTMSAAMTNCGMGWVADRKGYRYTDRDAVTGQIWPEIPAIVRELAIAAAAEAGFAFAPDGCLINRYAPGAKMGLHQDLNEIDKSAPIVSVSLGLPATFQFGGVNRSDKTERMILNHGDIVVWGGPSRMAYHGVLTLKEGVHPDVGRQRINLTIRKVR